MDTGMKPAKPNTKQQQLEAAQDARIKASKKANNDQIKQMKLIGILPPGAKPKAKHYNLLAAYHNSQAAAGRATLIQRDLAAIESIGGVGAAILATFNNPNAKATERAIAMQAMIQTIKSAPQVVSALPVGNDEDTTYIIDDSELDDIEKEFAQ
jgi:hypothetical protein